MSKNVRSPSLSSFDCYVNALDKQKMHGLVQRNLHLLGNLNLSCDHTMVEPRGLAKTMPNYNEAKDWIIRYDQWSRHQLLFNPNSTCELPPELQSTRPHFPRDHDDYDNDAIVEIECADPNLIPFLGNLESAVDFYNDKHSDAEIEVVELVSGSQFYLGGPYVHLNFKAKPKAAIADVNIAAKTYFAELYFGETTGDIVEDFLNKGKVTGCCVLDEGYTRGYCLGCQRTEGVRHPMRPNFEPSFSMKPFCLNGED